MYIVFSQRRRGKPLHLLEYKRERENAELNRPITKRQTVRPRFNHEKSSPTFDLRKLRRSVTH